MAKRKIVPSESFERSYKKFVKGNASLKKAIQKAILQLEEEAFSPILKSHKLSGALVGLFACSCGYDCRIIFSIEKDKIKKEEVVLLIDIGSHEDVY
jgi:mRNA interferase YafQ